MGGWTLISILLCLRHCRDAAFVGGSGFLVAATGMSVTGDNLIVWDTLAPPTSSRASVACHDGKESKSVFALFLLKEGSQLKEPKEQHI